MYFFDNKYLQQYLDSKRPLKIYVDQTWYEITSMDELKDPVDGIASDEFGATHYFDYRDIEQVKIGNNTITQDMLQTQMTGKAPDDEKESKPKDDSEDDEEPGPELSHYDPYQIGKDLLKENRKRNEFAIRRMKLQRKK